MFIHRLKKLYTNNMKKLGHQAPQGYRVNLFNSIELDGDFALCDSHFIYSPDIEGQTSRIR